MNVRKRWDKTYKKWCEKNHQTLEDELADISNLSPKDIQTLRDAVTPVRTLFFDKDLKKRLLTSEQNKVLLKLMVNTGKETSAYERLTEDSNNNLKARGTITGPIRRGADGKLITIQEDIPQAECYAQTEVSDGAKYVAASGFAIAEIARERRDRFQK